jgi:hypothetical protein
MTAGAFTFLSKDYRGFAGELGRVLLPGGWVVLRLFCRPASPESVENVFAALLEGRIGNFHAFKWRLAMALQGASISAGVALSEIWRVFRQHVPDDGELASRCGFPLAEIATITNYRDQSARYTFSTREEALTSFLPWFDAVDEWSGRYELGERCPTVILQRR